MFTCCQRLLVVVSLSTVVAASALAQDPQGQDREALAHRLDAKREELGALQREVDQLTRLLGQEQVILCTIQRVEFEMAELQASGVFPAVPGETEVQRYARLERELCNPLFVEQLDKREIAFVNTMPIVMRANDPTLFTEGGEFPFVQNSGGAVSVEYKKYGTGMELVGSIVDVNHLRVELNMHCSELHEAWKRQIQGNESYALETSDLKRTLEGSTGTTFIIWHPKLMRKAKKPRAATDIAWLITPQLFVVPPDSLATANRQPPASGAIHRPMRFRSSCDSSSSASTSARCRHTARN